MGKSGYVLEIMTAKQFASDIDNMLERYSKEKDFTKENFLKKSMLEVSVEKLQTLYNPVATHSNSYAVVSLRILARMAEGDVEGARQIMYNHMNFIQSQINKFNAWRKSKADSIVANKGITDTSKRVQAKPESYSTYNPKTHEWETSDRGVHGGSIELGAVMLKEAELLKNQFNALKAQYFQGDPNLNLVENSNSTVTDDYIKKEYAKYLKHSGKEDVLKLLDTTPELDRNAPKQEAAPQNQTKVASVNTNQNQSTGSVNVQASANTAQQAGSATVKQAETTSTNFGKGEKVNKPGLEHLTKFTEEERNTPKSKAYAGIGSRQTPQDVLDYMKNIATRLENEGLTLRSGHAEGADKAFESGSAKNHEIYLADDIQNNTYNNADHATQIAYTEHPNPKYLKAKSFARNLMARNSYQVLGSDLNTPVDFVVCYAPLDENGVPKGGTSQAIRIANDLNIPVFNLAEEGAKEALEQYLDNYTKQLHNQNTQAQQSSASADDLAQRREAIFNEIKQEKAASKQKVVNANESIRSVFANVATNSTTSKEADASYKNSILTKVKNKL